MDELLKKLDRIAAFFLLSGEYGIKIPQNAAVDQAIKKFEKTTPFPLTASYKVFLSKWNGMILDVIRFGGVGDTAPPIPKLENMQSDYNHQGLLIFGSDIDAVLYAHDKEGRIFTIDIKNAEQVTEIAPSFKGFIIDYLFSEKSSGLWGHEIFQKLKSNGLIDAKKNSHFYPV